MHKGAIASPIPIGRPIPLIASDLERLKETRHVPSTPQRLRDSHHMIARLAAMGLRPVKIAEQVGYSYVRVQSLLNSPAMDELVARYRAKVDDEFVEGADAYFEIATKNMLAAERHIADAIAEADEQGELIPIRTALAISRDAADRFGYGKHQTNVNVNVDFAAQLEKCIKRSGKTIDSVAVQPQPRIAASSHHTQPLAAAPQPLLRRA